MSTENTNGQNSSKCVENRQFCSEDKTLEETRDTDVINGSEEVAQKLTDSETLLDIEANNVNFKQDLEEESASVSKDNAKSDIILQNSKEINHELDVKIHKEVNETINDTKTVDSSAHSDVHQILLEVIDNVTEKYNMDITEKNDCTFDREKSVNSTHDCEEMDTAESGLKNDFDNQTHDLKRTHEQAALGTSLLQNTDDQSYVMAVVQEELSAVEKLISNKERVKIVDYESGSSDEESDTDEDSSESSSSDTDSSSSSESSTNDRIVIDKLDEKPVVDPPKTKDEILLNELPPEPLVDIALTDDVNLVSIGVITSIVECVVVIRALPKTPAVDADTLLFLENRKCIGKVFETFGPVRNPFYSVRFNSQDEIDKTDVKPDLVVYFAPEDLDMTKLIFTSQIEKYKGSDASWKHDQEPPIELIEYSDDEEEKEAKAKRKQERKANKPNNKEQETPSPSPTSKPNLCRKTWQGRGRGARLPHPGATQPTNISQSSFPGQPGQFVRQPFIPPGHYMPPPPPSFNIPPPPLPSALHHGQHVPPPHFPPPQVHHGHGIPFPSMHHGQVTDPATNHGLGILAPHPAMHPGPRIPPPPSNLPDFRNVPPPMMPLGPGAHPAMHAGLNSPVTPPGRGRHTMHGGPPPWPLTFPPPRQ